MNKMDIIIWKKMESNHPVFALRGYGWVVKFSFAIFPAFAKLRRDRCDLPWLAIARRATAAVQNSYVSFRSWINTIPFIIGYSLPAGP